MRKIIEHGIEGISNDPKYWISNDERKRDAKIRHKHIAFIVKEIAPFHADQDIDECLVENLTIDFEMNDSATLDAIVDALKAR